MEQRHWIKDLRELAPRVHCITNYVTARAVADMVLAAGGSPIMAQGIDEVEDVTSICQSLVLNIGTLDGKTIPAMIAAGQKAAGLGHPVILDPVGVTASRFRRQAALEIIRQVPPSVIRGNEAEIRALEQELRGRDAGNTCGVDSSAPGSLDKRIAAADSLRRLTGAVVVMTGVEDVVAGSKHRIIVRNGHPWMARITGSGCMLDGIIGAFCALEAGKSPDQCDARLSESNDQIRIAGLEEAVAAALCAHGLCGEIAAGKTMDTGGGTGTFGMYLLDAMSLLDDETLERGKKIEIS